VPGPSDLGDRLADDADRRGAASGQHDALGAQAVGIGLALEVVEALELAEQVVEGLLGDPEPRGQLGRARALGLGVLEHAEVREVEVGEAAVAEPLEGVLTWTVEGTETEIGPGETLCIPRVRVVGVA